jgi:hypothetical protein
MGLFGAIGSVVKGAANWVTSPIRMGWNALKVAGNALQMVGNLLTLDGAGFKKNLGDMWDATKGVAFAGVQMGSGPVFGTFLGMVENGVRR